MKSILILGGNRFVGLQLAESLSSSYNVTVFNRSGTGPKNTTVIQGDRNKLEDLNKVDFSSFSYIFDFCLFKPEQFLLIKDRIAQTGKYIFISTAAVYSNTFNLANSEQDLTEGRVEFAPYGKEKADCEQLIANHLHNYVIFRLPYIDGQGSHRPRTAYYFNQLLNNLPIAIDSNSTNIISVVWVDDLVKCFRNCVDSNFSIAPNKVYNLTSAEVYTVGSYIDMLAKFLKAKPVFTIDQNLAPFSNANLILASNSLSTFFKPISTKLENFYNWYTQNSKHKYGY